MGLKQYPWTEPPKGNCYAFAANDPAPKGQGRRPTPGAKMGKRCTEPYTPQGVFKACLDDGFMDMSNGLLCNQNALKDPPQPPGGWYLVAVYVREAKNTPNGATDFHFVRREWGTNHWIHKMGPQDACNWDDNFKEIGYDLASANFSDYTFVGFMAAPHFGVAVEMGN